MNNLNGQLVGIRAAGDVKRFHTMKMVHYDDVAKHSWNVCNILLLITNGGASKELLVHALSHDMGEYAVGDIPSPTKRALDLGARMAISSMERDAVRAIAPWADRFDLQGWEEKLLVVADCIDGMMKAMEECDAGREWQMLPVAQKYLEYIKGVDLSDPALSGYSLRIRELISALEDSIS